jgi:ABC-2 type transport system ATP-binding protein/lipopolysaccharide transport system ATP-binding protein
MPSITLDRVNIEYPVFQHNFLSLRRTLIKWVTGGKVYQGENSFTLVHALKDISFNLQTGDRLGLVGPNGAGKSTLLKTLGRLYTPRSGRVHINGKVSALFDVCMGMDVEKTGYSNIYYMGMLLGLTTKQIKSHIPDIEEFSELGGFLDMPVRTYSAGMRVRLGFALCTCINPAILLLDEALGAGDKSFMEKAAVRAKSLYDRAEILVLASHANSVIRDFCNKALWLEQGVIKMFGPVETVLAAYEQS